MQTSACRRGGWTLSARPYEGDTLGKGGEPGTDVKLTWHYKLGSWIGYHIIDSSILAIVRRRWIFRDWIACARVIPHYQKRFLKKRFDGDEEAKAWCESEIDRIANMNREWRSGQKNQNGLHTHRKDAAGLEALNLRSLPR
jgi:hypothetical protein